SRDAEVPPTFEITNRFPILIGFDSARANRFNQLRGNGLIRPPNSLNSANESLRQRHTISSVKRLHPGLRTTTSTPPACFWRSSSCALTQRASAVLRHRYTGKRNTLHSWPSSRSLERVTRLELATSTLARWCSTN